MKPESFDAVRPLMTRMSSKRLHNAYEVLVLGRDCGEVARAAGVDYKIVHRAATRVYERWQESTKGIPHGWVRVSCLAPAAAANAFLRDVEKQYKQIVTTE